MASLGDMIVKIGGDTSDFEKSIKEINNDVNIFGQNLKNELKIDDNTSNFNNSIKTISNSINTFGQNLKNELTINDKTSDLNNSIKTIDNSINKLGQNLKTGLTIDDKTSDFNNSIKTMNNSVNTFSQNLKAGLTIGAGAQIFESLFDTIVGGFKNAMSMGWQFNSTMEQNLASFTTLLNGSSKAGENLVNQIQKMAETTPFETSQLSKQAEGLLNANIQAQNIVPTLQMLGDASLGNVDKFSRLGYAFSQVATAGKMTGEDLQQFLDAGFNPLKQIAQENIGKKLGLSFGETSLALQNGTISAETLQKEMSKLKDETSKGNITFDMLQKSFKLATSEGGAYFNSMNNSSKTFEGQMSTLKDSISLTFGAVLKPLFEWVSTVGLPKLIQLTDSFKNMVNATKESKFFTAIKSALETLQPAINVVKNYFNDLQKFIEPWVVIITNQIKKFANDMTPTWDYIKNIIKTLEPVFNNLKNVIKFVIDTVISVLKILWDIVLRVVNGIIQAFQPFLKAVTNVFGIIINVINLVISLLTLDFAGAWKSLQGIILNVILAIKNILSTLFNFVDGFFKGAITKFVNFGKEILNGIWKGMSDGTTWLINKVKELAGNIAGAIKNFFGIASPSKLMAEYGGYIAKGLGNGISDNSDKAKESAKEMADKVKEQFENLKQSTIEKTNKMGDIIISALKKQYDAQEKAQTTSLNKQIKELQNATDLKIKQYDKELLAQLKILDNGTSERVKQLQTQIDEINKTTSDEEKALKLQEYNNKVTNLQKKIIEETSAIEKVKLQDELNNLIAQKEREHQLEIRSNLIKSLQNEIETIKSQNELKKEQLKLEFDNKKENEKNLLDLKVNSLNTELENVKKHYDELRTEESLQADARRLMLDKNNQDLVSLLNSYAPNWKDAGKSFGEKLLEGINSQKQNIINAVNEMMAIVNRAGLPSQNVQNTIPAKINTPFTPFTFGGKIPALANGGIVNQPTLALIGESGSEAVIPLSHLNNYGGTTVYVQLDGRTIAKASAPAMVKELKMQGVYA